MFKYFWPAYMYIMVDGLKIWFWDIPCKICFWEIYSPFLKGWSYFLCEKYIQIMLSRPFCCLQSFFFLYIILSFSILLSLNMHVNLYTLKFVFFFQIFFLPGTLNLDMNKKCMLLTKTSPLRIWNVMKNFLLCKIVWELLYCTQAHCVPPPPATPVTRVRTNIERYLNSIYLYNGWNSTNLFHVLISVYIMWCTLHRLQITKHVILYFLSWYEVDRIHYIWCYIYHCFHSNVSLFVNSVCVYVSACYKGPDAMCQVLVM